MDFGVRLIGINAIMSGSVLGVALPVHVVKRFLKDERGDEF